MSEAHALAGRADWTIHLVLVARQCARLFGAPLGASEQLTRHWAPRLFNDRYRSLDWRDKDYGEKTFHGTAPGIREISL